MADTQCPFRFEDAPLAHDRTAGWRFVRDAGQDVVVTEDGRYLLVSNEAVQIANRHPEVFSSAVAYNVLPSPVPLIPLAIDPPAHKDYRRILDPMLAPRVIDAMAESLRSQVRELISAFADSGSCNIVDDLGRLYPTQVFLTLFGMPLDDRDQFIEWVEAIVENSDTRPDAPPNTKRAEAGAALVGYLRSFIEAKRAHPGDDMLSRIIGLSGDDEWTDDEVLGLSFLFTLAGLDTVTASIGFTFLHLARNPELRRRLVDDPSLVGPVIEEILRLELPAPAPPRYVLSDIDVCGTHIPAGSTVLVCIGAANRDPAKFASPDEIDLSQADTGHLTFGGGIHRCLGSHLARRELRLVVEEFHKLIPDYELAPDAQPEVVWPSGTLHLTSLPLVFPAKR